MSFLSLTFEEILEDPQASPSEVARVSARHFVELLGAKLTKKKEFFRDDLERLVAARPFMAGVLNLVNGALLVEENEGFPGIVKWIDGFLKDWENALSRMAQLGMALIPPGARVLTLSRSTTVLNMLGAIADVVQPRVVCAESYPGGEGRLMAKHVAEHGVHVEFRSDSSVTALVESVDLVLIGGCAVGRISGEEAPGLLTKTGALGVLKAARAAKILAYGVVPPEAVLPSALSRDLRIPRGAASELWPDPPPKVQVRNPVFEWCPVSYLSGLITEGGAVDPIELIGSRAPIPRAAGFPDAKLGAGSSTSSS